MKQTLIPAENDVNVNINYDLNQQIKWFSYENYMNVTDLEFKINTFERIRWGFKDLLTRKSDCDMFCHMGKHSRWL